jgi:hypothetical protein
MIQRRGDVAHAGLHVEGVEKPEGRLPFRIGVIAEFDAWLDAPEKIGTNGQVAGARDGVGDVSHDLIDPEYLLDHHHCRGFGRCWPRDIGAEDAVRCGDGGGFTHS